MKPLSGDISVVVQGPLNFEGSPGICQALDSIFEHFPRAEVIVSTWANEEKHVRFLREKFPGIRCLLNEDPGAFKDWGQVYCNLNRQILSTYAGISASTRPYVLKTRSDILFCSDTFAFISEEVPSVFARPLTITSIFSWHPEKIPALFHPSDIIQFGTRTDMLDFWNTALFKEEEILTSKPIFNFSSYFSPSRHRIFPEQALTISWLNRNGFDAQLKSVVDLSQSQFSLWEKILQEGNFHIMQARTAGVVFPPRFAGKTMFSRRTITESDFTKIKSYGLNRRKALIRKHTGFLYDPVAFYVCVAATIIYKAPFLYLPLKRFKSFLVKFISH